MNQGGRMQLSPEGVLTQLGYHPETTLVEQFQRAAQNTPGFEKISKHLVALNDHLKNYHGFVALSNSQPRFKIKIESQDPNMIEVATQEIYKWADKYNVRLQKVQNAHTYYIVAVA